MKLLTLTQPWATLVAIGAKRIETRSWQTDYRGPIAIHAGKGLNGIFKGADEAALRCMVRSEPFASALLQAGIDPVDDVLPRACVAAVADLTACIPTSMMDVRYPPSHAAEHEFEFGDYTPGRYAWVLENVRPLATPFPLRGERGLQTIDPVVATRIMEACQ